MLWILHTLQFECDGCGEQSPMVYVRAPAPAAGQSMSEWVRPIWEAPLPEGWGRDPARPYAHTALCPDCARTRERTVADFERGA